MGNSGNNLLIGFLVFSVLCILTLRYRLERSMDHGQLG